MLRAIFGWGGPPPPPTQPPPPPPGAKPPPPGNLPPPGLKLEGGSLTGEAVKYIGTYRLAHSKLVNGRPAYQHTRDATRWIVFAGDRWMGQTEDVLGEKKGLLDLRDSDAASPDVSTKPWKACMGSAWVEAPQLKCTAWSPPPPGLKLEGGSLTGDAAKYIGTYRPYYSKLVNGWPAYQHVSDATRWIAFVGNGWMGQPEEVLGEKKGFLNLTDSAAASPDLSANTWQANAGGSAPWVEAPQLKCTAWTPPPAGLKLEGDLPTAAMSGAADFLGTYRLDRSKLVNGRPAYQHTRDATLWIAFVGNGWMCQFEEVLGEKDGLLDLRDSAAASPDVSTKAWKVGTGSAWVEAPQLKCTAWSPPPPGLKLEGGSLSGDAAKYIGTYRLDVGTLVNGRPAYQHMSDATLWITFVGNGWMGQPEEALGQKDGLLDLRDSAAASPDVSAKTWKVGTGSKWVEMPELKCTVWTPPPGWRPPRRGLYSA